MNKQEIYDKVCAHLAQQKTRSRKGEGCAYRGEGGRMCAVGALIPEELYRAEMDNELSGSMDASMLIEHYPALAKVLGKRNTNLLCYLQSDHDNGYSPESIRQGLIDTAKKFRIQPGAEQAITEWS